MEHIFVWGRVAVSYTHLFRRQFCALDAAGERLMQSAFDRLGLTGRSHDRILRMARTIADLEGAAQMCIRDSA